MKMSNKKFKAVAIAVSAVLVALVLAVTIAVGVLSDLLDKFVVGYQEGGEGGSASRAEGNALVEQIQSEGTVLVQNNDDVLPLDKNASAQVNVFGWAAVDWVISGSGSGQVKRANSTDFLTALEEYEISYNQDLIDFYRKSYEHREFSIAGSHAGAADKANPGESGSLHSFNYQFSRLYEPEMSEYSSQLLEDAKKYSNTAIVVIGRVSGESNDSPKVQYKNVSGKALPGAANTDETRTYLEISTEEEALLEYVGANYRNVVVLINSTNVMELGFLEEIDGLDSCLIVATTGSAGAKAIPKILYGDINPSGRLADTYAYDLSTSSTYVNTGSGNDTTNFYTNGDGLYPTTTTHTNGSSPVPYEGVAYTDYLESVYLGYRWYETADEMGFWESNFANSQWGVNGYDEVVQYPFGYGMSYPGTEFTWTISYLEIPNNSSISLEGENSHIEIGVTVTNTGSVPGQDVVELYYSAPYYEIEKSSVVLGAFAKTTQVLDPGESEDVILELDVSDMTSYDYRGYEVAGGGFVLEAGEYVLTLRTDAHTIANDKIAGGGAYNNATIRYTVAETELYNNDTVYNHFTGDEATDGVPVDGDFDGDGMIDADGTQIPYLTRSDFEGTFPAELAANRSMSDEIKELNLLSNAQIDAWMDAHEDDMPVTFGADNDLEIVTGSGNNIEITELGRELGMDKDDQRWEDLLDMITKSEMENLVRNGYTQTAAINSIGKPKTYDYDGPNQAGSFMDSYSNAPGFSSIVLAQTWNKELAYSMGLTFGKYCAENGITGWYGPGINLHRSPFGGRNYEYYSEDTLISGTMAAQVVKAAKNCGVFAYLKHVCLYETESGRDGMYTWVTEQALRELYLKPFEMAVVDGGSTAIMTSYGRIGAVWTGGSNALLNELITDEWGFEGAFLTDYSDHTEFMDPDAMLIAGGDLFMRVGGGSFDKLNTNSVQYENALRESTHDLVYMWLNALATNAQYNDDIEAGIIDEDIVIPTSPKLNFRWYIPVVVVFDVLALGGAGTLLGFAFRKKKSAAPAAPAETPADSDNK